MFQILTVPICQYTQDQDQDQDQLRRHARGAERVSGSRMFRARNYGVEADHLRWPMIAIVRTLRNPVREWRVYDL